MYPCGEINVSEKSVVKSCVAKLSVAKSTYTALWHVLAVSLIYIKLPELLFSNINVTLESF